MAKQVSTHEVKEKLDNSREVYLIDTLAENSFSGRHIPGAINVPYGPRFMEEFEEKVGASKDAEIIAYCASSGCQLSSLAAEALVEAGYELEGEVA